jgi:CheY-like chemotaxis protein
MARVLVAEDDNDIRALLPYALDASGHQVEMATDGHDALHRYRPGAFDLLCTDLDMPNMTGVGLTHAIRTDHDDAIPILMSPKQAGTCLPPRAVAAVSTAWMMSALSTLRPGAPGSASRSARRQARTGDPVIGGHDGVTLDRPALPDTHVLDDHELHPVPASDADDPGNSGDGSPPWPSARDRKSDPNRALHRDPQVRVTAMRPAGCVCVDLGDHGVSHQPFDPESRV